MRTTRDANVGRATRVRDGTEHRGRRLQADVGMLHVDNQCVEADPCQEAGRHDAASRQPSGKGDGPFLGQRFNWIGSHKISRLNFVLAQ